ncbi:MAG: hypothetical protein ACR2QE_04620 [Acidimicrobiales bacterium]
MKPIAEDDNAPVVADESPEPAPFIAPDVESPMAGFCRFWAIAIIAHLIANPPRPEIRPDGDLLRFADLGLGAAALWLFLRPDNPRARLATAVLLPLTVWFEAPFIGNHWLLAGLVSIALLISHFRADPWAWFAPTARILLIGFYTFAALAKLNEGFFDAVASCGVFYTNQSLDGVLLPGLPTGGLLATGIAAAVAAIELSVPVLLAIRRTRYLGVAVAMAFHFAISLDLNQHFYDFTSLLFALFVLFLTDGALRRLGRIELSMLMQTLVLAFVGVLVFTATTSSDLDSLELVRIAAMIPWVAFGVVTLRRVWGERYQSREKAFAVVSPAAALLLLVVIANGLTPYLEVKTSTSWNMYANLVTGDGESNHFLVRQTAAPFGQRETFVAVVATNDEDLEAYIDSDLLVPRSNLDRYLSDHPDSTVTISVDGNQQTLTADDVDAPNVFEDKFLSFRSIDEQDPPRCQTTFLPAR